MTVSTLAPRARRKMRPPDPPDAVTQYAIDVLAGRYVAGVLVRRACERHLADLAAGHERGLAWDAAAAQRAIDFFPLVLCHYQGAWAGKPVILEEWEKFVIGGAFGWKRADGTRRFRHVYLEVAKKNGKTLLAAGIAILLAFFDGEPGAQVYSIATKRDQAKLVWNDATQMVARSPSLAARITAYALNLTDPRTASFFRPLGRDSGEAEQGINAHAGIVDELHVIEDRDSIDNIETSMAARRQPMLVKITTAGKKGKESVWAAERADALAVVEGRATDDAMLVLIYTLDEGDDPFDEAVWPKANPNLDVSVDREFLRSQAARAARSPARLAGYLQLHMNVPTTISARALDLDEWDACAEEPVIPDGAIAYAGLDLASVSDLTAFLVVHRDADSMLNVECRFYCPAAGIERRTKADGVPYTDWVRDGYLVATPGNTTDYDFVREDVLARGSSLDLREIGYDRWNASQLVTDLADNGAVLVAISQTHAGLTAGWRELEKAILDRKIRHGGNPVLRWMAGNVEVESDAAGNQKPSKARSTEKIDGMVALTMAVGRLTVHAAEVDDGPLILWSRR